MTQNIWGFPNGTGQAEQSGPIEVTSSGLALAGRENRLIPGATYRVIDYRSVNWLNGQQQAQNGVVDNPVVGYNPKAVHTGDIEPLLIKAITTNRFDSVAYSEKYTDDVLNYDPYVQTLSATWQRINNGSTLPNSTIVSGFDLQWDGTNVYFNMPTGYPVQFGVFLEVAADFNGASDYIYYNWETVKPGVNYQSQAGYKESTLNTEINAVVSSDGKKVILEGLTFTDYQNYDTDSLDVYILIYEFPAYGWVRRRTNDNLQISLGIDWRNFKYRRYQVDMTGDGSFFPTVAPVYMACGPSVYGYINPLPALYTGLYKDFYVIGNGQNGWSDFYNIKNSVDGAPYWWYWLGSFQNIVFAVDNGGGYVSNVSFEYATYNATIYNADIRRLNCKVFDTMTMTGTFTSVDIDILRDGLSNGISGLTGSIGDQFSFGNCANATVLPDQSYSKTIYNDGNGNLRLMRIVGGVVTINSITQ
jgi:hypothetical protein